MGNSVNRAWCEYEVRRYLVGQGWELVAPSEIVSVVWPVVAAQSLQREAATKRVQTLAWQQYGIQLHNACCDPADTVRYERAWHELRALLVKQVTRYTANSYQQEEVVQIALLKLHKRFQKRGLDAPQTIYLFCRQTLKHSAIDWGRSDKTVRGKEVEWDDEGEGEEGSYERPMIDESALPVEDRVTNEDTRQRLTAFFAEHLPTDLQRVVAQAHFIDGLAPAKVARLLSKKPHEVRLTKARVVKKLRNLSPVAQQQLLQLLRGEVPDEG